MIRIILEYPSEFFLNHQDRMDFHPPFDTLFFMKRFQSIILVFLSLGSLFSQSPETYTVCTWNIQNWGVTDRFVGGHFEKAAMKPEEEMKSVVSILKRIDPDILGVSEILRHPQDLYLKLLRDRLKSAGLNYPHLATVHGSDPRIQCAIFSRYPILEHYPHDDLRFEVTHQSKEGLRERNSQTLLRGLLHVRIQIRPDYDLQLMQVHLKSKRVDPTLVSDSPDEDGDDFVRRQEALLTKNAMSRVLAENPKANLLLMGDLNDTPRSKTVKTLIGSKGAELRTFDLWLRDWLGDWWTHYYIPENRYERLDYMVASEGLMRDWIKEKSYLYRSKEGDSAEYNTYTPSDHRPLVAVFRASNQR
jgi:endonuclease/exonuclease/phosphatase family metal-dependent hydrolase